MRLPYSLRPMADSRAQPPFYRHSRRLSRGRGNSRSHLMSARTPPHSRFATPGAHALPSVNPARPNGGTRAMQGQPLPDRGRAADAHRRCRSCGRLDAWGRGRRAAPAGSRRLHRTCGHVPPPRPVGTNDADFAQGRHTFETGRRGRYRAASCFVTSNWVNLQSCRIPQTRLSYGRTAVGSGRRYPMAGSVRLARSQSPTPPLLLL